MKRALEVFDRLLAAQLELRLYFVNGLRADTVTEEFVDKAIAAGAIWFTYAVESASEEIQRLTRKGLNLAKAQRIIAYTQRKGVVVNITTMYGFPGETPEQAQLTLDWLGELPKASLLPYHFCLRFFPGCDIREQALAAGFSYAAARGQHRALLPRHAGRHADAVAGGHDPDRAPVPPAFRPEQPGPGPRGGRARSRRVGYTERGDRPPVLGPEAQAGRQRRRADRPVTGSRRGTGIATTPRCRCGSSSRRSRGCPG